MVAMSLVAMEEPARPVAEGLCLAGILDDPAIETDAPGRVPLLETDPTLGPMPDLETDLDAESDLPDAGSPADR